jgi:hypothetical protein
MADKHYDDSRGGRGVKKEINARRGSSAIPNPLTTNTCYSNTSYSNLIIDVLLVAIKIILHPRNDWSSQGLPNVISVESKINS